jgi:hypothetical protein
MWGYVNNIETHFIWQTVIQQIFSISRHWWKFLNRNFAMKVY